MDRLDMEFFDKYKDVDKFCGDMLSSDSGISEYIDQMEKTPASERRYVPSWERDYRMLKHLRYVRNQIAHANNDVISTEEDFFELNEFYDRLLNSTNYGKNSGSPLKILALSAFVIAVLLIAYYMSQ